MRISVMACLASAAPIGACGETSETSSQPAVIETSEATKAPDTTLAGFTASTTAVNDSTRSTAASDSSTTSVATNGEPGEVELELTVFDWTETNAPGGDAFVVVEGIESWTPDLEFFADVRSFGTFEIGEPGALLVYPDGNDGSEIEVDFVMTKDMISGSDMAMTHVEIYDSEVLVWGMAIPGIEQTFDR